MVDPTANPSPDSAEPDRCFFCGAELTRGPDVCPRCGRRQDQEITVHPHEPVWRRAVGVIILILLAVCVAALVVAIVMGRP